MTLDVPNLKDFDARLRAEANEEPTLEIPQSEPTKKTQIIAIYGKGGIGKSFTLANLSHMMAEMGKRVLLIGCDPKSDTTRLLFGGKACPTIIETSTRKKLAGEEVKIGDVCFKRGGVFAMELGGPEVGRGCGGRGIIHGFELLEKLGFHDWDFDYVLLDFLGDVVCGGFGLPIARDMAQKVILVGSNDLQSLYVANNVCSAVEYFRQARRQRRRCRPRHQQGRRHRRGGGLCQGGRTSRCWRRSRRTTTCARNRRTTRSSAPAQSQWGAMFAELAEAVGDRPADPPDAADAGRAAEPVLGRDDRQGFRAGARHRCRHARQERRTEEIARSGVRRCLISICLPFRCRAGGTGGPCPSRGTVQAARTGASGAGGDRLVGNGPRRAGGRALNGETTYDTAHEAPLTDASAAAPDVAGADWHPREPTVWAAMPGRRRWRRRRRAAGQSELLDQFAEDYPQGPHDKPQSMCPAFGSLRVGLRMRRVATVLSGSACCVYGLTFVSHFYGARRSVGYVPFNSETLVTGKLFEDIREAVHELADPDRYDAIVVTNLCVPTASGVPLQLLPSEIDGVRIVGIDVPGFGIPTHAEAKDVLAGRDAELCPRRDRGRSGAGAAAGPVGPADGGAAGRDVPGRPDDDRRDAGADGAGRRAGGALPRMARALRRARLRRRARRSIRSTPPRSASSRRPGARWSGRRRSAMTARRLAEEHRRRLRRCGRKGGGGAERLPARDRGARWPPRRSTGTITLSGYEGSELLVARLLIESGADVPYVGTACARTPWSEADRDWLEAHGVTVKFRA